MYGPICLSPSELAAFNSGELHADRWAAAAEHLESCTACQSALEALPARSEPWVAALGRPPAADAFEQEPQCQEAVARFEAIDWAEARADQSLGLEQVSRYQLLGKLGRGGMGQVYLARHVLLKQLVALKVLPPERLQDRRAVARFYREIEAVGRLKHPNIVAARDAGEADGVHYLIMELVDGADLARLLEQLGPLPIPDACELVRQAAVGLQHAHEHRLVHRDVKPSNLMLAADGQVKVLDLGLARLLPDEPAPGQDQTPSAWMVGTWDYLAPEAVTGGRPVDARSDLYSLGCTLYKLLTGRVPFGKPTYEAPLQRVLARLQEPVPSVRQHRPEVPEELAALVHRLLARDPAERFASAAALAEALRPFAAGCDLPALLARARPDLAAVPPSTAIHDTPGPGPDGERTQGPEKPPPGFLKRKFIAAAVAVGSLLVALVAIGIFLWPTSSSQTDLTRSGRQPPDDMIASDARAPLKGDLDVLVWESSWPDQAKFVPAARRQHIRLPPAVPLSPRDWLRIEARLNRPAYLYLIWIDTEGKATPIFPWQDTWDKLPANEQPRDRLSLPEKAGDLAPLAPGPAGMETLLLLAREMPLTDADNAALPGLFSGLPLAEVPDLRAAAWFEGGELVTPQREPDRGPIQIGKAQAGADSVLRVQVLLQSKLRLLFTYSRAVCFGNTGK
jgi:serine/threonine protein kinase